MKDKVLAYRSGIAHVPVSLYVGPGHWVTGSRRFETK